MPTPTDPDIEHAYRLGIAALDLASERVKAACRRENIDEAAVEAHFGLHAVYDLHEIYFASLNVRTMKEQDEILAATDGASVGALSLARGARTHQLVMFARPGHFGDLPYGMGPFGGGWLWKEHSWTSEKFDQRAAWYDERVKWRYLWVPLDEAWGWFLENPPQSPTRKGDYLSA